MNTLTVGTADSPTFYEMLKNRVETLKKNVPQYEDPKQQEAAEVALHKMLLGNNKTGTGISYNEAMNSRDFPLLLNRVINDRILLPQEPDYIGQTLLSTTVSVGRTVGLYNIPAFTFLEAQEVGEAQEYPEALGAFRRNATSVMIKKYGIRVAVTAEMLDADELGLFGMHIMAAKLAMNRKKEEVIFDQFMNSTSSTFDNAIGFGNSSGGAVNIAYTKDLSACQSAGVITGAQAVGADQSYATTGCDMSGNLNGTIHLYDMVDTMAALVAAGYSPTDCLLHPIAWAVFAQNPMFNGFEPYSVAPSNANVMDSPRMTNIGPDSLNQLRLPWAMSLHVTPFVGCNFLDKGSDCPLLTNIFIGSRRNGVLLLQGMPLSQDSYSDLVREIYNVRLREYYGVGLADMGQAWKSIKNVRVAPSYERSLVVATTAPVNGTVVGLPPALG